MDLNALRQFLVVARLEHLSHAADELHVAQPSLSRTIARLEAELGAPLFDRAGRLRLNDTGKMFRGYVERALGELDAGRRAVAESTSEGAGTVRLASETFLTLTGPLAAFKRAHPSVDVHLRWSPAEDMARHLRAQDVDFCVASQPIATEGLESVELLDEPVLVATPIDHPLANRQSVTVDDLAGEPLVTSQPGHWLRRRVDRLFASRGLTPNIVCEGDEPATIAVLISAGFGIGLVPGMARDFTPLPPSALVAVDHPECRRTLTLHWNADSQLSAAARLFRRTVTEWPWTHGSRPIHTGGVDQLMGRGATTS